jgi:uncharacterized protein
MKFVLLLLAVLLLLWMLFGRARRRGDGSSRAEPPSGQTEAMVTCAHCGVHLPRSEALSAAELSYCSPAHRDAGPRPGAP